MPDVIAYEYYWHLGVDHSPVIKTRWDTFEVFGETITLGTSYCEVCGAVISCPTHVTRERAGTQATTETLPKAPPPG